MELGLGSTGSGSVAEKSKLSRSSLLRYLRAHSYVTVPQLRWRFGLLDSDEVSALSGPTGTCYVGLPKRAARLLQDLWREGRIGFEWVADLNVPLVLGAFAIRSGEATPAHSAQGSA